MSSHEKAIKDMYKEAADNDYAYRTSDKKCTVPKALDVQCGGKHYKQCKIQPIEYIIANNLSYIQGNIVKYITRYKDKNGKEDILKIKHYCDLLLELEYDTNDATD